MFFKKSGRWRICARPVHSGPDRSVRCVKSGLKTRPVWPRCLIFLAVLALIDRKNKLIISISVNLIIFLIKNFKTYFSRHGRHSKHRNFRHQDRTDNSALRQQQDSLRTDLEDRSELSSSLQDRYSSVLSRNRREPDPAHGLSHQQTIVQQEANKHKPACINCDDLKPVVEEEAQMGKLNIRNK